MSRYQTCPHCKISTPKKFDKILQKWETRRQCPECGTQYDSQAPVRGVRIFYCPWCNHQFTKSELVRIDAGEIKNCPDCKTLINKLKTVRVHDPDQAKLPGAA
jgi:transcription elongation factor Elf1